MRAIKKNVVMALMMTAVLIGSAGPGFARPKKYVTKCTCTCVAYDELGKRHEGGTLTFDTPGQDCTIGINVKCKVGNYLEGAYASCMGKTRLQGMKFGSAGDLPVLDLVDPPSKLPALIPATR
jgi:hypothetical protein